MMVMSSLYLTSALGAVGKPNDMLNVIGEIGSFSAAIASLIGSIKISRTYYEHRQSEGSLVGLPKDQASRDTAFSLGKMSEDMGGMGLI